MSGRYASYWNAFLFIISLEMESPQMNLASETCSSKSKPSLIFIECTCFIVVKRYGCLILVKFLKVQFRSILAEDNVDNLLTARLYP